MAFTVCPSMTNSFTPCLCAGIGLPETVMKEVQAFTDVNVAWLSRMLVAAGLVAPDDEVETQASAIVAAIAGAQLMARSRADIALFDRLVRAYRSVGLLPS